MIAPARPVRRKKSPPAWHEAFLAMMPTVKAHAKIAFRHLLAEAREEAVQEVLCNACSAFARLVERGKADLAYPSVLARYGVAQVNAGRKVGCSLNINDVASDYCQRRKNVMVERLDAYDAEEDAWQEVIVEDKHAGPADVAITRIDFATWLELLPKRLRKIATFLASSETTTAAARRFRVSKGRISQIRKQFHMAWNQFQGDQLAPSVA
jgi:hypothetical protein